MVGEAAKVEGDFGFHSLNLGNFTERRKGKESPAATSPIRQGAQPSPRIRFDAHTAPMKMTGGFGR
jgi:hypothetical protein